MCYNSVTGPTRNDENNKTAIKQTFTILCGTIFWFSKFLPANREVYILDFMNTLN